MKKQRNEVIYIVECCLDKDESYTLVPNKEGKKMLNRETKEKLDYMGWHLGYMLRGLTPEAQDIVFKSMKNSSRIE